MPTTVNRGALVLILALAGVAYGEESVAERVHRLDRMRPTVEYGPDAPESYKTRDERAGREFEVDVERCDLDPVCIGAALTDYLSRRAGNE